MGYAVQRFITPVDANLLCGICSTVLEDPVLTPCGHSFCMLCLETWLSRPGTSTCPECRNFVSACEAKPILSLRSLINGFEVECDNTDRGCKVIFKLERVKTHLDTCGYFPVECAGCGDTVNRFELATHQMQCEGIAASVQDEDDLANKRPSPRHSNSMISLEVSDLLRRISSLEFQMKTLKRDLQIADSKNRVLEREYKKTREELEQKKSEVMDMTYNEYDPEYKYGYTPQSIANLSLLIARFLLKKPSYIDRDKVFNAAKRCYEQYARCGNEYEHDVHMLVATAFASNWFEESQKRTYHCWLKGIARRRQLATSGSW